MDLSDLAATPPDGGSGALTPPSDLSSPRVAAVAADEAVPVALDLMGLAASPSRSPRIDVEEGPVLDPDEMLGPETPGARGEQARRW